MVLIDVFPLRGILEIVVEPQAFTICGEPLPLGRVDVGGINGVEAAPDFFTDDPAPICFYGPKPII